MSSLITHYSVTRESSTLIDISCKIYRGKRRCLVYPNHESPRTQDEDHLARPDKERTSLLDPDPILGERERTDTPL